MGRICKYQPLYPWSGGLNTSIDPMILDSNYLTIADNIIFTNSGSRKKRGGQVHYNSTKIGGASAAQTVVHLTDYWATVSSAKREYAVAITASGKAYRSPYNGTWSSFSTLTLSVTHGGVSSMVINNDLVIGIQGSGVPKRWASQNTSTNLVSMTATSGSLPFTSAWICSSFLNRGFFAGDPANPDRVYISKTGDYRSFTTSSTVAGFGITLEIGTGDGDPEGITAMFPGTGADYQFYVAKRKHLYRIDCSDLNQNNWNVVRISDQIGCVGQSTVATIDMTDVIFASDRGVHTLGQVVKQTAIVESKFLSFPIQYDYKNVISTSDRTKMSGVYVPGINSYLLSCKRSGQTTFETVYGYNIETEQWFRWTATPANFLMSRFNKSTGTDELYAAADSGYVNLLLQSAQNDFGLPIVTRLKSTFIASNGIPFMQNQYTNLACIYRSHDNSSFRVYYSVDGLTTQEVNFQQKVPGGNILATTLLGAGFILGQIQAVKPVWNHLAIDEGASIQLTFEHDTLNADFELFGVVLEYQADEEAENAFTNPLYSAG